VFRACLTRIFVKDDVGYGFGGGEALATLW
jgi:hypothetical protein